jgi:hypothetical protein
MKPINTLLAGAAMLAILAAAPASAADEPIGASSSTRPRSTSCIAPVATSA